MVLVPYNVPPAVLQHCIDKAGVTLNATSFSAVALVVAYLKALHGSSITMNSCMFRWQFICGAGKTAEFR